MLPIPGIPLIGQGMPLPENCPYEGEWLLINSLFLYRPTPTLPAADLQFTAGFQRDDGEWCAGFDASVLAKNLGVSVDGLFAANRDHSLKLAGVEDATPT